MPEDYHDCRHSPLLSGRAGHAPSHRFHTRTTPRVQDWPRPERRVCPFDDADSNFVDEVFRQSDLLNPGKLALKPAHGAVAKTKATL